MRNTILSTLSALTLTLVLGTPSFATSTFNDSEYIGEWAAPSVETLVDLGVLSGYPDGSFSPYWSITREEYAVSLLKGLELLNTQVTNAYEANDIVLYETLIDQQIQLLDVLVEIDELKAINAVEKSNYFAIGLGYNVNSGVQDDNSSVQLLAKIQVVELSDKLAISIRPFVTTGATGGAAATLDFAVTDKLDVFAGGGAAASWSNGASELTGTSDVVGLATAGIDYKVTKDTVAGVKVDVPLSGSNSNDPVVTGFFGWQF